MVHETSICKASSLNGNILSNIYLFIFNERTVKIVFIWERLVPKIDPYLCPLPAFFPVEKLQSKNKLNQKN